MRPEDIPRRQERLILADATQKFERLLITRIFATHDIATFAELSHMAPAQQIAYTIGMPRTTVLRKLQYMLKHGYVTARGTSLAIQRFKR